MVGVVLVESQETHQICNILNQQRSTCHIQPNSINSNLFIGHIIEVLNRVSHVAVGQVIQLCYNTPSMKISTPLLIGLLLCTVLSLRTLAILDNKELLTTHSLLLNKVKDLGPLDLKYSFERHIDLKHFDEYKYDTILVLCTSEQIVSSAVSVQELVDFFDNGGNLIIAGDIDTSRGFRKLFFAFGIELDEENHQVKDGFSYLKESTTLITHNIEKVYPFVDSSLLNKGKLLYRGTGLKLADYVTNQLFALVKGESTTYSYSYTANEPVRVGEEIALVAAVQGLRNTRAVLTGSLDFLSDQFLSNKDFDNSAYVSQLISWVSRQTGILRVNNISHYSNPSKENEQVFTVTSRIHFECNVEEFDPVKESWKPYLSNDLAVEFVMLDPWVIVKLNNQQGSRYHAEFDSPTKEGIYQFKVIYEKPGFNFIKEISRVTLRPKKHDQFERFLFTAWPYYAGTWATILGTLVFVVVFLYNKVVSIQKQD